MDQVHRQALRTREAGFTMVEMLVVLGISGFLVLAAIELTFNFLKGYTRQSGSYDSFAAVMHPVESLRADMRRSWRVGFLNANTLELTFKFLHPGLNVMKYGKITYTKSADANCKFLSYIPPGGCVKLTRVHQMTTDENATIPDGVGIYSAMTGILSVNWCLEAADATSCSTGSCWTGACTIPASTTMATTQKSKRFTAALEYLGTATKDASNSPQIKKVTFVVDLENKTVDSIDRQISRIK